jgi:UDP-xylose:glucoside alpha-1,3-xylosyltransferase
VIYIDADFLCLSDLQDFWNEFGRFSANQIMASAYEVNSKYYTDELAYPYYGSTGINAGVLMMNLTRMRQFNFISKIYPIYNEYKQKLVYHDQDILNILFHDNPGERRVQGRFY